jgi:hypothetical protein
MSAKPGTPVFVSATSQLFLLCSPQQRHDHPLACVSRYRLAREATNAFADARFLSGSGRCVRGVSPIRDIALFSPNVPLTSVNKRGGPDLSGG